MGALSSIVPSILQVGSALGGINRTAKTVYQDKIDLDQLQQRQSLSQAQAERDAALAREELAAETQSYEQQRRAALRRAVAKQKAVFGSTGISSQDGSAEAVLLGLFSESEEERQAREKSNNLRESALQNDLSNQKQINLLQKTQLQQRQKLNQITSFF